MRIRAARRGVLVSIHYWLVVLKAIVVGAKARKITLIEGSMWCSKRREHVSSVDVMVERVSRILTKAISVGVVSFVAATSVGSTHGPRC